MTLEMLVNGVPLHPISYLGRTFVVAPEKGEFTLRLCNNAPGRQLGVISVDGVNVLDGKPADAYSGAGYVVQPLSQIDVLGWHRDNAEVAAFTFTPISEAYATVMPEHSEQNVGVVGVAVFDEHAPVPVSRPLSDLFMGGDLGGFGGFRGPAGGSFKSGPTRGGDVGAGYGRRVSMQTRETTFEKASPVPTQVLVIQYAVRSTLAGWGVPLSPAIPTPSAFPGQSVKAPPGWRG